MDNSIVNRASRSFMIISKRDGFAEVMSEVFPEAENNTLVKSDESLQAMNGRAVELAFDHDVVIIEADPDDEQETQAIGELLSHRTAKTVFLALTGNDVSIEKARKLRALGIDEVLPLSIDGDELKSVVDEKIGERTASLPAMHSGSPALGHLIPVTQARGGIGATTVAVNLACALARKPSSFFGKGEGNRVALLDFDLQFGNANVFLDIEDNGGFLQLIEATEEPDERFVLSTLQQHPLNIDVLCAPQQLVPLQSMRQDLLKTILTILRTRYDYIIVDLPRAVVDWVEPILKQAAELVMITDTSVPCVRQARRMMDLYREENVGLPVELVVNREQKPLFKSEHIREAEKILDTKLIHWVPDNAKLARNATDLGQPVMGSKPKSDMGKALGKLAAAITVVDQKTAENKT